MPGRGGGHLSLLFLTVRLSGLNIRSSSATTAPVTLASIRS